MSTETAVARRLRDFLGNWQVAREIRHASGLPARFEGRAEWHAEGAGADYRARYVENGTLRLVGQAPMTATQSYLWRGDLSVWFPDGRLFHHVPPRGGCATHFCAPDLYKGGYDFSDWPEFVVTWQVRGPRKDYTMRTVYRR